MNIVLCFVVTVRKATHKNREEATCEKRVSRIATNKNHDEANLEEALFWGKDDFIVLNFGSEP